MLGMYILLCEQNAGKFENWTNVVYGGWLVGIGRRGREAGLLLKIVAKIANYRRL